MYHYKLISNADGIEADWHGASCAGRTVNTQPGGDFPKSQRGMYGKDILEDAKMTWEDINILDASGVFKI